MAKSAKDLLPAAARSQKEEHAVQAEEVKDRRIAVRLTASLYHDFAKIVSAQDKTMSAAITRMIRDYVEQNKEILKQ